MLPAPSKQDLATFTGRDVSTFSDFADQALAQAALVLSILTKRDTLPDDPNSRQLAINAILELADKIYLEQPYAAAKAAPFSSETIGSYSYTRMVQQAARNGQSTGLVWWDLAIDQLTLAEMSMVSSSSVQVVGNDLYRNVDTDEKVIIGPADLSTPDIPFDFNGPATRSGGRP